MANVWGASNEGNPVDHSFDPPDYAFDCRALGVSHASKRIWWSQAVQVTTDPAWAFVRTSVKVCPEILSALCLIASSWPSVRQSRQQPCIPSSGCQLQKAKVDVSWNGAEQMACDIQQVLSGPQQQLVCDDDSPAVSTSSGDTCTSAFIPHTSVQRATSWCQLSPNI